jgi:hypothetical protein
MFHEEEENKVSDGVKWKISNHKIIKNIIIEELFHNFIKK